jgi:hypothetical protein
MVVRFIGRGVVGAEFYATCELGGVHHAQQRQLNHKLWRATSTTIDRRRRK